MLRLLLRSDADLRGTAVRTEGINRVLTQTLNAIPFNEPGRGGLERRLTKKQPGYSREFLVLLKQRRRVRLEEVLPGI
jgi:hypothetical protein